MFLLVIVFLASFGSFSTQACICNAFNSQICQAVTHNKGSLKEEDLIWLRMIKAIQHIENPKADPKYISPTKDYGLMQIKPATAFEESKNYRSQHPEIDSSDPWQLTSEENAKRKLMDPKINLYWGFLHLARKIQKTDLLMSKYASCKSKLKGWERFEYAFISYHLGSLQLDPSTCSPLRGKNYGVRSLALFQSEFDPNMNPVCGFKTINEFCQN